MQIKLCYFNQQWNIYLYTKKGIEGWMKDNLTLTTIRDNDPKHSGIYNLREYRFLDTVFYNFGFMADNKNQRPGHGGEWSSNARTINKIFNVEIIECAIDQTSMAVQLKWLKELLGDQVIWSGTDGCYVDKVIFIKGISNPEYMQWVELTPLQNKHDQVIT